jgi:hypothetical protein
VILNVIVLIGVLVGISKPIDPEDLFKDFSITSGWMAS